MKQGVLSEIGWIMVCAGIMLGETKVVHELLDTNDIVAFWSLVLVVWGVTIVLLRLAHSRASEILTSHHSM